MLTCDMLVNRGTIETGKNSEKVYWFDHHFTSTTASK